MIIARPSSIIVLLGLMVLLIIATAGALMVGATGLGFRNLLHVGINGKHDASWLIVTQIRGPRAFLAILAGAALAASGTVMQGLFRNPLADRTDQGVLWCSSWRRDHDCFGRRRICTGLSV